MIGYAKCFESSRKISLKVSDKNCSRSTLKYGEQNWQLNENITC